MHNHQSYQPAIIQHALLGSDLSAETVFKSSHVFCYFFCGCACLPLDRQTVGVTVVDTFVTPPLLLSWLQNRWHPHQNLITIPFLTLVNVVCYIANMIANTSFRTMDGVHFDLIHVFLAINYYSLKCNLIHASFEVAYFLCTTLLFKEINRV